MSIGFRQDNIHFIPISGLHGTNLIVKPAEVEELSAWYKGPTLIELLDQFKIPKRNINKPIRVCIYDYYKGTEGKLIGDCISAKIESGIIKEKDNLVLMPLNI